MSRGSALVWTIPITVAMLLVTATTALGAPCYGGNNGAARTLSTEPEAKGLQTVADLVPGMPFNPTVDAIVHPAQIGFPSGDFLGWGTAIGAGTGDCPTYTGTRWQVYVDGYAFGAYFCRQSYGSEPASAPNQDIEFKHTVCNGPTRWAFYWNSTQKTCQLVDGVRGMTSVGGESIGYDPQHIDIHYKQLKYRVLGGTWTPWHVGQTTCVSAGYKLVLNGFADVWVQEQ